MPGVKLSIDTEAAIVTVEDENGRRELALDTAEAFDAMALAWVRASWDVKYVYSFTWMGRPVIQLPDDLLRMQEAVYAVKPDVILETGIAHGGSLIFNASLCEAMGHGRVIGVDIEIRPHNRTAIEAHEMFERITLLEGSSIAPEIVDEIKALIAPGESVICFLDSNHTKDHVRAELEAYAPLIPVGSYIVATDGVMGQLVGAPRAGDDWGWNNPTEAAREFLADHPEFALEPMLPPFNEGVVTKPVTYFPDGWLKRVR
jgi:cephalosporin hydroxylase